MARAIWIFVIFLLVGCSTTPSKRVTISIRSYPSQNTSRRIQFIVLHYTVSDDAHSIKILTKERWSSHYLIPSQPAQKWSACHFTTCSERLKAWHAGDSRWQYHHGLNDSSIGIEIVNEGLVRKMVKISGRLLMTRR